MYCIALVRARTLFAGWYLRHSCSDSARKLGSPKVSTNLYPCCRPTLSDVVVVLGPFHLKSRRLHHSCRVYLSSTTRAQCTVVRYVFVQVRSLASYLNAREMQSTQYACYCMIRYCISLLRVSHLECDADVTCGRASRSQAYRKKVLKVADARISLVGEVIDGIKTVKLNSMSKMFQSRVGLLREKELASIRHALTLNACNQVSTKQKR